MADPLHPTTDFLEPTADSDLFTSDNEPIPNTDMQVDPSHNTTSLLLGTGEFSFCENASSVADTIAKGWLDFGNVMAFTPDIKPSKTQHVGSYRGVRKVDRQVITQIQTNYKLKLDEWNLENVRILFGASDTTGFTQGALSAASGAVLGFTAVPAVIGRWYDLMTAGGGQQVSGAIVQAVGSGYVNGEILTVAGGTSTTAATVKITGVDTAGKVTSVIVLNPGVYSVAATSPNSATGGSGTGVALTLSFATISPTQVRNLTAVTITSLTEGTDFVLDLLNGRIKFLTAQATNRTPVLTAPAVVAGDANAFFGMIPMNTPTRRGYGRLTIYDQNQANKVVMQHYNFSCDITLDTSSEIDGTKWNENTVDVLVTNDPGVVYLRQENSNSGVAG